MQISIYTDGACDIHAENQPGGWAAILRAIDDRGALIDENPISGGAEHTTNNQMELTAVIEGLKALKRPAQVTIFTDSRYVIDIAAGTKKAAKNRMLWQRFYRAAERHKIEWRYVRGHAGDPLNERCDRLAVAERVKRATADAKPGAAAPPASETAIKVYLSTRYSGKLKAAAWGAVIADGRAETEYSGRLPGSTEMECTLVGAIRCLETLPPDQGATVYTAQEYLSKGMKVWLPGWQARNWKSRKGEAVKYRKHWQRLHRLSSGRAVYFHFVRSHRDMPQFMQGKQLAAALLKQA